MIERRAGGQQLSRQYIHVRSRQLEGTYPGDAATGTWVITALRVMRGWGQPPETAWPYNGDAAAWPPAEPAGVDRLARPNRIWSYLRVRDLPDCRTVVAAGGAVVAAFEVTDQWASAAGGVIELPEPDAPASGSHTVLIVGYDDGPRRLKFANSWGEGWGDRGYGYLPDEFFERHLQEAWTMGPDGEHRTQARSGLVELQWGLADVYGGVLHGVEIYEPPTDDALAWGFAVARDGWLDVEELFVRPDARRRGFGGTLARMLLARSDQLDLPIRLWVPHADAQDANLAVLARLAGRLGLRFEDSPVAWASYVVTR